MPYSLFHSPSNNKLSFVPQAWYPVLQLCSDLHEMESLDFKKTEERDKIRLILNKITKGVDKPIVSESIRFPGEGLYAYIYSSSFLRYVSNMYRTLDFKSPLIARGHSDDTQELLEYNRNMQNFHEALMYMKMHISSKNDVYSRQDFERSCSWRD